MAQSRLEKIGTIFTRVTGLLRSGAMKPEDKPIWYDLYEAFPPKLEPRFDRPASNAAIRNIFYEEDIVRAKYHSTLKQKEMVSLFDRKRETQSQQFIAIYQGLKSQGALDEEKIFETAVDLLHQQRTHIKTDDLLDASENEDTKYRLTQAFNEAKEAKTYNAKSSTDSTTTTKGEAKQSIGGIDIQNLFKD